MAKMKRWTGSAWEILDARDADTLDGHHASDFLLASAGVSAIKSIQVINFSSPIASQGGTSTYTITVNAVNTAKTMVIVGGAHSFCAQSGPYGCQISGESAAVYFNGWTDSTHLRVASGGIGFSGNVQVVEFN